MDVNRLVQFRAIVETGNFRKAAELMNISHSGLSKSMKALELELGFALFQPSGRGVVVSDQGRLLFERSGRFLAEYERLLGRDQMAPPVTLRIASFETFTSFFIGPLLKNYFPDLEVEIHELVPGRLEESLVHNRVDLGITYEPVPQKGIDYVKAATIQMGIFALKGSFTDQDVSEIPFVTPVSPLEGAPSGVRGRDGWPTERIARHVVYRVDLLTTALEIARQGLGAVFMPGFVARLHNERSNQQFQLAPLKLPRGLGQIKREVYIVRRESTAESKQMRLIARALRETCLE